MSKISVGPQIPIRALREAYGLTTGQLADMISELGVKVDGSTLRHIELGDRNASTALRNAWATVLKIRPADFMQGDALRSYLTVQDDEAA